MVLLAILHLGEDVYGVPIVDEIARRTGREVAPAAVYVTLRRLEEKGLVSSWMGESTAERGGKARRLRESHPSRARESAGVTKNARQHVARPRHRLARCAMTPGGGRRCTPPRTARAIVERVLPADVRESIAGDLDEFFQRDCRTHGAGRARLRYWRHATALTIRFGVERGRTVAHNSCTHESRGWT